MSSTNMTTQRHFLVSVDVADGRARTDLVHMQAGLQRAAATARLEGLLTSRGDEEAIVTDVGVSSCPRIEDLVMAFYGGRVEHSDEALRAIAEALDVVASNFRADRLHVLNDQDRELLVEGIGLVRTGWERNEEGVLADAVRSGCEAWIQKPDADIITDAMLENYCLGALPAEQQVKVLHLMARSEGVMRFIQESASDDQLVKLRTNLAETLHDMAGTGEWAEASHLVEQLLDELGATFELRAEDEPDSPGMSA